MKRSAMTQSTKPMKRGGFAAPKKFAQLACRKTPSAVSASSEAKLPFTSKSGLLRTANIKAGEPKLRVKRNLRSKQRAVTGEEKALWNRMATEIGCIACWIDGVVNSFVSIHHIDGRTKPGCHKKVLPVCAPHHQRDDSDPAGRISIHPDKKRFEQRYGSQYDLLAMVMQKLNKQGEIRGIN